MDLINSILSIRFWNKHGMLVAWGLAAFVMFAVLASIGWTTYASLAEKKKNYQPQTIAPISQSAPKNYRVADIVAANLFGNPKPVLVVENAPKTTLNLKLQGILWADDQQYARAIIQSGNKNTELYSVGEKIKDANASVKEIRSNEVLLNRNGATESLPLVKSNKSGDRELITFSSKNAPRSAPTPQSASEVKISDRFAAAKTNQGTAVRSPNGAPRKVRKPNFSGLDRALKKMGEL